MFHGCFKSFNRVNQAYERLPSSPGPFGLRLIHYSLGVLLSERLYQNAGGFAVEGLLSCGIAKPQRVVEGVAVKMQSLRIENAQVWRRGERVCGQESR